MNILQLQNRLKKIEDIVFYEDKDKWRLNIVYIAHKGTDEDINNNKKYCFKYNDKDLVYDNIEDFYKEYNVYPKKDINPYMFEIVDNRHLESVLYDANKEL